MASMKTFLSSTEGLVKLGFLLGLGLVILSSALDTMTGNGASALVRLSDRTTVNTTLDNFINGISQYGGWVGLVVLIIVGAYFFKSMNFGGGKS